MSKIRQRDFTFAEELPPHADGVMHAYIVYTSRKDGAPHRYAGYLDAPDIDLALEYACEHYGQDEACAGIWVHLVEHLHETPCAQEHIDPATGNDGSDTESDPVWIAFTQKRRGDIHIEAGTLHAADAATALSKAVARHGAGTVQVRVVLQEHIESTMPEQLIWRTHDQTYRLARGYSKSVRAKWDAVRKLEDVDEYTKEDIEHHF
jgi:1,2-phenylacetyl-CoA epoxidase PaaB subunit